MSPEHETPDLVQIADQLRKELEDQKEKLDFYEKIVLALSGVQNDIVPETALHTFTFRRDVGHQAKLKFVHPDEIRPLIKQIIAEWEYSDAILMASRITMSKESEPDGGQHKSNKKTD